MPGIETTRAGRWRDGECPGAAGRTLWTPDGHCDAPVAGGGGCERRVIDLIGDGRQDDGRHDDGRQDDARPRQGHSPRRCRPRLTAGGCSRHQYRAVTYQQPGSQ